jgi:hypothetical protein
MADFKGVEYKNDKHTRYERAAWLAGQLAQAIEAVADLPDVEAPERKAAVEDVSTVKAIEQRLAAKIA